MGMNRILAGVAMAVLLLALTHPSSASDFTLGVFGNANEDDTINMQDVTYTELIILEYRDRTELADGKYDDKINMQDVTQIELVILGKEKELTFLDIFGEAVTVDKPIERLACLSMYGTQVLRALGARDMIVVIGSTNLNEQETFYPEISKLPAVGSSPPKIDYEMILSTQPDAVLTSFDAKYAVIVGPDKKRTLEEKLPDIPLISLNMREPDVLAENIMVLGYILGRSDEAEEFIDWHEGYIDEFTTITDELTDDERPRYYFESHGKPNWAVCPGNRFDQAVVMAGGRNILADIVGPDSPHYGKSGIDIEAEWLVEQNPGHILTHYPTVPRGYETDDTSGFEALKQEITNRPGISSVDAAKNGNVFIVTYELLGGAGNTVIGTAYMGKVLHPDLFEDIDPQAIHQEYVDKFCYIDFDVSEHGVFFYPLPEGG